MDFLYITRKKLQVDRQKWYIGIQFQTSVIQLLIFNQYHFQRIELLFRTINHCEILISNLCYKIQWITHDKSYCRIMLNNI